MDREGGTAVMWTHLLAETFPEDITVKVHVWEEQDMAVVEPPIMVPGIPH